MCGIAGNWRWDGSEASGRDVQAMCDAIVHRGPDDEGVYVGDGVAMGMRRLSIIDLSSGRQPIGNEDQTIHVVFNGEIYNYRELQTDLQQRGHRFRTRSDTEVIVHLYEEYGERALERLRGMFAFALWDARRHELLIARDRLGIKPLFYAATPGGFAFASEIKALLRLPGIGRDLDWSSVAHLFAFLVTPATRSILSGIEKLEPGHYAIVRPGRPIRPTPYWTLDPTRVRSGSEDELLEELEALMAESMALHMRSDVPVGAFLSGGVDSSAVVAWMARGGAVPPRTFSVGFEDARFDERPYARHVAEQFGTEHHELVLSPQPVEVIEDIAWHLDEPFGDSSAIPTYMISRLAAEHVKVVLTGDGGDELFGGYDKYVVEDQERRLDRIPGPIRRALSAAGGILPTGAFGRRFLMHMGLEGSERYLDASTLFTRRDQARLFARGVASEIGRSDPAADSLAALGEAPAGSLAALQYCDLRGYLPLDILVKVDRMSMAHSIEARPVLLDHRLVEFALALPAHMKIRGGTTKYLFKRMLRGRLPTAIVDRPKQGFAVPLSHWFRGAWTGYARDLLLSARSRQRGIVNPRQVERLFALHDAGRDMDREIWMLLSFEQWCRVFLDDARVSVRQARGITQEVAMGGA